MSLWGFQVAEYIEKSQPEYVKADRELRQERVSEGMKYAYFNHGTAEMQYVQTAASRIVHKVLYIVLTLVSLASIILGGFISKEAELTSVGIFTMIASLIASGFLLWWLGHQLLVRDELTYLASRLAVRNFRIAGFVYAIILSVSAVLNSLIPVIYGSDHSTNIILFIIVKFIGASAIWAILIIELNRRIIPISIDTSRQP